MKRILGAGILKHLFVLLAILGSGAYFISCTTDEVDAPPLTGPSGHRLFITMSASPDHLVMKKLGKPRPSSRITAQLKDDTGAGVAGANIKLRITNSEGVEINIGSLSQIQGITDSAGFARATYTGPNLREQPVPTRIYVIAILRDPAYTFEVTGRIALDLEAASLPIDCVQNGPGAPTAEFTANPGTGTINEPSCFDAQGSTDPDGTIVNFVWNFGDGGVASGSNVCHTFTQEGLFNVTLTVQDDDRNCTSITQAYEVGTGTAATCNISVSPQNPPLGTPVNLIATITDDRDVVSFQWNFGDGTNRTTSTNTVSHNYTSEGSFTVTLTITDDQGNVSTCTTNVTVGSDAPTCSFTASPPDPQVNEPVIFNGSESTDEDGSIVRFAWNFGDGGTDTGDVVTHTFTSSGSRTVTLELTDDQGNVTTCSEVFQVTTGEPPDCELDASPATANIGQNVNFTTTAIDPEDGSINVINYSFGDGFTTTDDSNVSHVYTIAGNFTATASVTDSDGNTSTCTDTVTVGSGAPTCSFSINPGGTIPPGTTVTLDASASADPDGGALTFAWSTPGSTNTTGTGVTFDTTYNNAGSFTATLTVTDIQNQTSTCSQTVTVQNALPLCQFTQDTTSGLAPLDVNFDASGSTDQDEGGSSIVSYNWVFGDGNNFSTASATTSHTFTDVGTYNVTLTVRDDEGGTSANACTVVINATGLPPTADITSINPDPGTVGVQSTFDASGSTDNDELGSSIVSYEWDFDDGTPTVTTNNPSTTHTYATDGIFSVTLTVTDDEGQTDVVNVAYTVDPAP